MKQYLSFGGGVNSTAMLLLLTDRDEEFETVFVNHGGDYPATYNYIKYLREQGFEITEAIPDYKGCHTLYDYCVEHKIIPIPQFRWCTHYFKILPYYDYIKPHLPCVSFIGFDAGEENRVERNKSRKFRYKIEHQIHNRYPLFEAAIDRMGCIDLIKDHGLDVPPKSGCYFCPFQKNIEWRRLFLEHPDLYKRVEEMERDRVSKNKNKLYLRADKPISDVALAHTPPLTSYFK